MLELHSPELEDQNDAEYQCVKLRNNVFAGDEAALHKNDFLWLLQTITKVTSRSFDVVECYMCSLL